MKMRVDMDERQLMRSIEKAGKRFGDTTAQATARWGVQVCRELAKDTQAFGKNTKAKKAQENAIMGGMLSVIAPLKGARVKGRTVTGEWNGTRVRFPVSRYLRDEASINAFIESHRGKKGRTPSRVPLSQKRAAPNAAFNRAKRGRFKASGAAKGPWLGAGQKVSRGQKGGDRIVIGKNYLSYAQKHADKGRATVPRPSFSPFALLTNPVRHVGNPYVLKSTAIRNAMTWGAKATLTWYRRAAKRALDKQ